MRIEKEMIFPQVYPKLLSHFQSTHKAACPSARRCANIPIDTWMRSFLQEITITHFSTSLKDSFDFGLLFEEDLCEVTVEAF